MFMSYLFCWCESIVILQKYMLIITKEGKEYEVLMYLNNVCGTSYNQFGFYGENEIREKEFYGFCSIVQICNTL